MSKLLILCVRCYYINSFGFLRGLNTKFQKSSRKEGRIPKGRRARDGPILRAWGGAF